MSIFSVGGNLGFAVGSGGIGGGTILGLLADHFGVLSALESVLFLPPAGLLLSLFVRYP